MIFDVFDEDNDGYLSPFEMKNMWRRLKKGPSVNDWTLWFEIFCQTYVRRRPGHEDESRKITLNDLEMYYDSVRGMTELLKDYSMIFPDFDFIFGTEPSERDRTLIEDDEPMLSKAQEVTPQKVYFAEGPLYNRGQHFNVLEGHEEDDESNSSDDDDDDQQ